jgi:DNA mismatch endonuclease (patch repair protein)
MSRVKATGNRSTELVVENALNQVGISGWVKHPRDVPGRPDFYFPECHLALFVDGCFWHACPCCRRRAPETRKDFWAAKIDENRRRDERTRRRLRRDGFHVMRVWEHEVSGLKWLPRLRRMLGASCSR